MINEQIKRKVFTKKEREDILAKTDGNCGYCGRSLENSSSIDHKTPFIYLQYKGIKDDNPDNWIGSCISCNRYKSDRSVEEFRELIETADKRLLKQSTAYRVSSRFGVVGKLKEKVVFYFESCVLF